MLSSETALVAHKRIMQKNTGQPKLVKIAFTKANNGDGEVEFYVKTLTGKTMTFHADCESTTIEDLKAMIYDQEGIPPDQ